MLSKSAIYRIAQATLRAYAKEVKIPEDEVALQARTVAEMANIVNSCLGDDPDYNCTGRPSPQGELHHVVSNDLFDAVARVLDETYE